jgi:anti-sigma factor RsiW
MFEDGAGQRVTLYIGSVAGPAAPAVPAARANESAFRFSTDGPVPSFYWVDQGFGYAIAGKLPREILMNLAKLTYRQLP